MVVVMSSRFETKPEANDQIRSSVWLAEAKANDESHPRAAGYAEFAAIVQNWDGWLSWFTS